MFRQVFPLSSHTIAHLAWLVVALIVVRSAPAPSLAQSVENLASHRARLALPNPPENSQQVLTVFKQLAAEKKRGGGTAVQEVAISGQIGGMPNVWPETHPHFPWYHGQASFFLVDSKIARQFAQHAKQHGGEDNCVFCKQLAAKNVNAIAVVNLVDSQGKTLQIDLQKLVELKEGQTVTIRGKAKLLAGSLLQIDADGIYVHRPATADRSRTSAK
jgi:hypothetical protein